MNFVPGADFIGIRGQALGSIRALLLKTLQCREAVLKDLSKVAVVVFVLGAAAIANASTVSSMSVVVVPEPASIVMLAAGLGGLVWRNRRRT